MIIYVGDKKYNLFEDYIISLAPDKYIIWTTGEDIIIDDTHKIIIFMQLIPNRFNKIIFKNVENVNVFVCNTEQLTVSNNSFIFNIMPFIEFVTNTKVTFGIIDYSEQNVEILKKNECLKNIPIHYIPYQYAEKDLQYIKKHNNKINKICICGSMSNRRKHIIDQLFEEYNIAVNIADGFFEKRDKVIGNNKILLNISTIDEFTIFEHIRCDRIIFSENIIISEKKLGYRELDITDYVIWCEKETLGETIIDALKNYKEHVKIFDNKNKMKNIIDKRRQLYNTFITTYS